MKRIAELTVLVLGLLIFAAGVAHAFGGWPPLAAELEASGVGAGIRGALAAGWVFGSASMWGFGVLVVVSFFHLRKGVRLAGWVALIVGLVFLLFGAGAYLARDFNPHFLAFVAVGALLAAAAALWRAALPPRGST